MLANEDKLLDGVRVVNIGEEIPDDEVMEYIARGRKLHHSVEALTVEVMGDEVDLKYYTKSVAFDRIRRITGYLVGTLDRFNNGKRAEVGDRVKHGV